MTKKRLYELALEGARQIWREISIKRAHTNSDDTLLSEQQQKAAREYIEIKMVLRELEKNLTEE